MPKRADVAEWYERDAAEKDHDFAERDEQDVTEREGGSERNAVVAERDDIAEDRKSVV